MKLRVQENENVQVDQLTKDKKPNTDQQESNGEEKPFLERIKDDKEKSVIKFNTDVEIPENDLIYRGSRSGMASFGTKFKMFLSPPWKRFKKGSFLNIKVRDSSI